MTDMDETDLRRKLRRWTVAAPDDATRDRVIALAMRRPQVTQWRRRLAREIEHGLTDWRYGLAYKVVAAAACLMIGIGASLAIAPPVSVANVAFITNLEDPS